MPIAKFCKVGGSLMPAIPPAMLEQLELTSASSVSVTLRQGSLVLKPTRPRYSHAELLAMGPAPAMTDEDQAWVADLDPIGSEEV